MAEITVLGLFEELPDAASALRRLRDTGEGGAGRGSQDVLVMSSVPFPEGVLDSDKSPIRLPIITLIGAIGGICVGMAIAGLTPLLYLLRTGGKPLFSGPPIGIICYEFMMLTALTFCFFGALYEMRLPNWQAKVYDRRISEGMIGIAVHCTNESQIDTAESLCREEGAVDIRRDAREFE